MRELQNTVIGPAPSWPQWSQWPSDHASRLTLYWLVFSVSICAFVLDYLLGGRLPMLGSALHIVGMIPCGFAWLFARALFRPGASAERWPQFIVAALFVSCLILYVDRSDDAGGLLGYIAQLQALIGSAMLLMTFIEPLDTRSTTSKERGFRWLFAGGQAALVAVSFAFALPELSGWQSSAHALLATVALAGGTLAWQYRLRNPMRGTRASAARVATNPDLASAIRGLLDDEQVFLDPGIKVATIAARLGQPDYKISQCIVNDLGCRNFNQLVNAYRIDAAKSRLSQPDHADSSILVIAMDCGFGSLGPFNRAFKAQTDMTPTAFRRAALEA